MTLAKQAVPPPVDETIAMGAGGRPRLPGHPSFLPGLAQPKARGGCTFEFAMAIIKGMG